MKKVILGDTIVFKTTLQDEDGTAVTTGAVNLDITDSSGSLVLSENISHDSGGTYTETKSTDGWALGPVRQNWTAKTTGGTLSFIGKNEMKIVNAGTEFESYVFVSELAGYYPSITDYLDNQSEDHVIASYKYANRLLESLDYYTPLNKNSDGLYDQSVRDFCAWDSIHRIIKGNQISQVSEDDEGGKWYDSFKEASMETYEDWKTKRIVFKSKVSAGEAGILPPSRVAGSSVGTMLNNHDELYGSGFRGADYKRDWSVEITGTGTSGGLRECTFKWSQDGGLGTAIGTTSDGWLHLADQCYVRFTRGTHTGTTSIMAVNDKWTWVTNPVKNQVGGRFIARGY